MLYCYVLAIVWIAVWGEVMRLFRLIVPLLVVLVLVASSARAQSDPRLLGGYADAYRLINRDADTYLRAKLPARPIDLAATAADSPGMRSRIYVRITTPAGLTAAEFEAYIRSRLDVTLAPLVARALAGNPTRYGLPPHTRSGSDSLSIYTESLIGVATYSRHTVNDAGEHSIYFELLYG